MRHIIRWIRLCIAIVGVGGAALLARPGIADTSDPLPLAFLVHLPLIIRSEPPPELTPIPATATPPPPVCSCSADLYNCSDFTTHAQAQACYSYCISQGAGDIHQLDADHDGVACESLP